MRKMIVTAAERRERITAEISERTGITEAMIERLVRAFYDKVRIDPVLGPILDARVDDWAPHLAQMFASCSSVALMSGGCQGTPTAKHVSLPIDAAPFQRWLGVTWPTVAQACP